MNTKELQALHQTLTTLVDEVGIQTLLACLEEVCWDKGKDNAAWEEWAMNVRLAHNSLARKMKYS